MAPGWCGWLGIQLLVLAHVVILGCETDPGVVSFELHSGWGVLAA